MNPPPASSKDRTLVIEWQRLVENDSTCRRCGDTGAELDKAVGLLHQIFAPLDVQIELHAKKLSREEFEKDPTSSNQIMIYGKSLESWIGATSGQSVCCDVCGDAQCRTVELDETTYEAVPARLIVLAALKAYVETELHVS
jgi:hypothetical protein